MTNIVENDTGSRQIKVKTYVNVDINSKKTNLARVCEEWEKTIFTRTSQGGGWSQD